MSLEDFLTGFLEEIFDSEKKGGSDKQKKLSDRQKEFQSRDSISNLFAEDNNNNKKKSIGERDKIKKIRSCF